MQTSFTVSRILFSLLLCVPFALRANAQVPAPAPPARAATKTPAVPKVPPVPDAAPAPEVAPVPEMPPIPRVLAVPEAPPVPDVPDLPHLAPVAPIPAPPIPPEPMIAMDFEPPAPPEEMSVVPPPLPPTPPVPAPAFDDSPVGPLVPPVPAQPMFPAPPRTPLAPQTPSVPQTPAAPVAPAQTFPSLESIQNQADLDKVIMALSAALFDAYNRCDLDAFRSFLAEDIEFYHDQGGITLGAAALTESVKKNICGGDVRRELVPGTFQANYMKGYGAVELGTHRFLHPKSNNPTGEGKYISLWQYKDGKWRITREISYDHHRAQPDPEKAAPAK